MENIAKAPLVEAGNHDALVINMWVHGRSPHTQRAYRHDALALLDWTGKGIQQMTLADLQAFAEHLPLADSSRARTLNAVKSLFTFAHKMGYIALNVGTALKIPKVKNTLAQRILSEEDTIKMISLETNKRNHALLRLMYHAGLRVSEVVALRWADVRERGEQAQLTIFGKGGKTRQVLISASMYHELRALSSDTQPDALLFRSRKGGQMLGTRQVERLVREAARRAGIAGKVSPHWLRHAHASHSLDRGAPIHLVQQTLGHETMATTGKYTHVRPHMSSSQFLAM